ncbi:MAG: glycosyltransferase family 2 protein [Desulfovibrionales bacterium]
MLISVIIPAYNRAGVLGRAMESVLAQTLAPVEIVVVDDGSTDETPALLNAYADSGSIRVLHQENKGVSAARKQGIRHARGNVIALLDSDDYWEPAKLEKQLRFMNEGGWEICQTDEIWIRNGRRVNPRRVHAKPCGWIFERSLEMCLVSPSAVMFTRKLWERHGPFEESLPACEDYHLWLQVSAKNAVGFLPEPLTIKTGGHEDQLSRKIIGLDLYRIYSLLDVLQTGDLDPTQRRKCAETLARKSFVYRQGCIKRGKESEAVRIAKLLQEVLALHLRA